jgi:hypothetical protein
LAQDIVAVEARVLSHGVSCHVANDMSIFVQQRH